MGNHATTCAMLGASARSGEWEPSGYFRKALIETGFAAAPGKQSTHIISLLKLEKAGLIASKIRDGSRVYLLTDAGYERLSLWLDLSEKLIKEFGHLRRAKRAFAKPTSHVAEARGLRSPTDDELRRIAAKANKCLAPLIAASLECKRSMFDLIELKIRGVKFEEGEAILPEVSQTGRRIDEQRIKLTPIFEAICRQAIGDRKRGWVFRSQHSDQLPWVTVSRWFREGRIRAGIPDNVVLSGYGGRVAWREKARGVESNEK